MLWETYFIRHGLIFFGVPHAGGDHAAVRLGTLATKIAQTVLPGASKDIMETLKDGSMYTDILKAMFRNHLERFDIVSFYERREQASVVSSPVIALYQWTDADIPRSSYHTRVPPWG
jgi:hypothetical protein